MLFAGSVRKSPQWLGQGQDQALEPETIWVSHIWQEPNTLDVGCCIRAKVENRTPTLQCGIQGC